MGQVAAVLEMHAEIARPARYNSNMTISLAELPSAAERCIPGAKCRLRLIDCKLLDRVNDPAAGVNRRWQPSAVTLTGTAPVARTEDRPRRTRPRGSA
jgi:hypothetical protein